MARMAEHGVTWTALAYSALQDTPFSTEIRFRDAPTVTDDEIVWAIREAKSLGLRVCLKPVVNCADGTWRAHIGFFDQDVPGEPSWTEWFASYREFLLHAAAHRRGRELRHALHRLRDGAGRRPEAHWRALIADIRAVYSGPLTYNCDKYQEDRLTWWDAVDVYRRAATTRSAVGGAARPHRAAVEASGKPFFFMEAGCPSREGSPDRPNDWSLPGAPSGAEQLRYYGVMFDACARARGWGIHDVGLAAAALRRGRRGLERRLLPVRQARRRVAARALPALEGTR